MSARSEDNDTCQVCGRGLLPGERPTSYLTADRALAVVCELCRPRAEAAGWLRPEESGAERAVEGSREWRRPRRQRFSDLLARLPSAAAGGEEGETGDPNRVGRRQTPPLGREERPEAGGAESANLRPAVAAGGDGRGTSVAEALTAFNASNHRRTVAGLTRTLGPPRASALAARAASGHPGVRLTVAWELTWYQWEVGPGPRGNEVRESGKGETIDQLHATDRTWNLIADTDGTLEQRTIGAVVEEST